MNREIGLVSCVKTKQDEPKDLYTSSYFEKRRASAEWWTLSAKHGLLAPDGDSIEPYDDTLRNATKSQKRAWASRANERA